MARIGCTNHCGGCGRHFTGLTGFETHRAGGACNDPETLRRKNGEPVMQEATGFCNKMPGCFKDGRHIRDEEPVHVWQSYMNEEKRSALRKAWNK